MFYDNTEFQLATFHRHDQMNNNAWNSQGERIHLVLIGDSNIGKSKLIKRFRLHEEEFQLQFHQIDLIYTNNDRNISISPPVDCLLLLFDLSNQISFDHLIDRCSTFIETSPSICSLIGIENHPLRQITSEQINRFTEQWKINYYEITWKNNDERKILEKILDNHWRGKCKQRSLFSRIFHW